MNKIQVDAESQVVEKQKIVDFDIKEFTIELLISKYLEGLKDDENDIYIPTYQRNFVWNEERQAKFIESVLLGLPIPYIFTADTGDGRLEVVDGSQRLRTLVDFVQGRLRLKNLEVLDKLNGFSFSDLIKSRQRKFNNTTIRMISLTDKSDDDVRFMIFERINTGSDILKDMEKRKGIYGGKFIDFTYEECALHPLFIANTSFTANMAKRGEPQELIIRFFAYSDRYKKVKTGVNEFLNDYTEDMNKYFNKEEFYSRFDRMLNFVNDNFPYGFKKAPGSSKTPRVRFDSISVGVHLALEENPNLTVQNVDWIEGKEFKDITTAGGQNAPSAIKNRIEFVRNKLLN
ncbi:DUF262 domain-containing protein [Neolewinella lacunae]|uniref:DUF262 domain-containing protein n=1 Tax=Neolewinella lacunae TaxID=1517758 RepID=A0A923PKT7_9BACT|nr:DUF262 domain-containing protein [Neolewinella lacunae]MBC6995204.1 DUF262 domain-containing protein [Neolewinella lacunae]MDN3635487.1 DUF262 domain-containing protein [Neolewinella lacunae]